MKAIFQIALIKNLNLDPDKQVPEDPIRLEASLTKLLHPLHTTDQAG